ncbi:hypothetical protein D9M69_596450 [compost metagenome]
MFGLRFATDCTARTKNGQPAHSTIGTLSTSSIQLCVPISNHCRRWPAMASTVTATLSGSVQKKRRLKSFSSGSSPSSRVGISGSSVMPHLGQLPGWSCRISGCMGQV